VGYVNQEALDHTIQTRHATFWSTSRNELWEKGKTSGNFLNIEEIRVNCEQNSLLFMVKCQGEGACHTKNQKNQYRKSCFYRKMLDDTLIFFNE
ncbi:MAG: phosphoribosyl-AMP cyclohydrolase, partial [Candidatus Margulisbacteria bacterium]|nr:phosphoribosyl-AMP cyclohydrolase [Candidatus Margulisiibacteriota bacterium]